MPDRVLVLAAVLGVLGVGSGCRSTPVVPLTASFRWLCRLRVLRGSDVGLNRGGMAMAAATAMDDVDLVWMR